MGDRTSATPRGKPPSRIRRDLERAEAHRQRLKEEEEIETAEQEPATARKTWHQPGIDPTLIYSNLEDTMRKRRLERPEVLRMALMHVARWCMPEGDRIRYPHPDSMIRLLLATENIPTEPEKLLELIYKVYEDRGITFSLTETVKDLARIHGHRAFVPTESWPKCYVESHTPIHVTTKTPRLRLRRRQENRSAAPISNKGEAQAPSPGNGGPCGPSSTLSAPSADGPGPSLWNRIRQARKRLRDFLSQRIRRWRRPEEPSGRAAPPGTREEHESPSTISAPSAGGPRHDPGGKTPDRENQEECSANSFKCDSDTSESGSASTTVKKEQQCSAYNFRSDSDTSVSESACTTEEEEPEVPSVIRTPLTRNTSGQEEPKNTRQFVTG